MTFLFLVVLGLVIWVGRLQSRLTDLEAREDESLARLATLRSLLDNPSALPSVQQVPSARPASPPATPPQPASPVPGALPPASAPAISPAPATPPPATGPLTDRMDSPRATPAQAPVAPPPRIRLPLAPPPVPGSVSTPTVARTTPTPPPPPVVPPPPARTPEHPRPAAAAFDWEELIGVRLFSWVAGVALAVAAVFFLGYSIQQGWLQPPVRMAIGLAVGAGLLVGCELKAARRYPVTADALDGAAIVILFSTFFASYRLWQLVGPVTAFAMLALVTAVAVLLSIRRDSVFIALLGLVGGFSTPALLSTGQDNPFGLFGYLLLLNAGLGWVAYRKRWPVLVALSVVLTTVYQWGWVARFLTPGKLPTATAVFLAFPLLAFVSLGFAGRHGALDGGSAGGGTTEAGGRRGWFEQAAGLNAALPLLFALFMASSNVYGEHPWVLFGFLFCIDAGLFAVALWRRQMLLHLLGAAATLVVFAAWLNGTYADAGAAAEGSYPAVVGFASLFVLFYLAAGLAARHGAKRLEGPGRLAVYTAPLLLFVFPVVAAIEPAAAAPAVPFTALFLLLSACAAFALVEREGMVYFVAAFLTVAAEVTWSAAFLTEERLVAALGIYAAFGLLFIAVPLAGRRWERPLEPAGFGTALPLASIGLLLFLTHGDVAPVALWGIAALLLLLNGAILVEARAGRIPAVAAAGVVLSWFVIGSWWVGARIEAQVVPALLVVAGFSLVALFGQLWMAAGADDEESDGTQAALSLALVGHLFLLFVALQPALAVPPWPMLAVLALLDLGVGAAALVARRGEVHAAALGLSQVVLVAWAATAQAAPWPLVAIASAGGVAVVGVAWSWLSARRVADTDARNRFHAASIIALALGEALVVTVPFTAGAPGAGVLAACHVVFLVGLLAMTAYTGWLELALIGVGLTWAGTWVWPLSLSGEGWRHLLMIGAAIYLTFLAFPLALGRRVGRSISPHLAAVGASVSFFYVARRCLVEGGYGEIIGVLPVIQALLMGTLLAALLRIEPPSERALGRLALVAAAVLAFVTVAIPLQLEKQWITIGWALEGAALAWLFRRIPHKGLLAWGVALLGVVFVRLVLSPEVLVYPRSGTPIVNWYLYTYLTCAAAMLAAAWLFGKGDDWLAGVVRGTQLTAAGGTLLLFVLLNIEIADFYATGPTLTFRMSAGLAQNLTYTLGWAAFAVCLLAAGIVLRSHAARLAAIVLLTITVLKGFLSDVARLGGLYRVMSFVGLAICLSLVAVVLQRFVLAPRSGEPRS
jgi:uncharacterized membrane protein